MSRLLRPLPLFVFLVIAVSSAVLWSQGPSRPPHDPWPNKKKLLAIADPQEWYSSPGYHHDAAWHTLATIEKIGRESGAFVTVVRTDMRMITKQPIEGYNVRNLNYFDAIYMMGEGPWNITDQQKADLLSFIHEDGKGFVGGHASNGGHLLSWPEYAKMVGGNLVGEFDTFDMPVILEDPKFPGVSKFPPRFSFKDQYTVVGPNFSRSENHVIMSLDGRKLDRTNPKIAKIAALNADKDYPIVWAKMYGKGRVWYSTFGHLEETMDDPRIQSMYLGAIKWAMGMVDTDLTPHPAPSESGADGSSLFIRPRAPHGN